MASSAAFTTDADSGLDDVVEAPIARDNVYKYKRGTDFNQVRVRALQKDLVLNDA